MPWSMEVPPGSTSNMSMRLDDVLDLVALADSWVEGSSTWALWAKATMARVSSGLSLAMAAMAASCIALEPADAGAVFLVHRAADVEHQGQVQAQRLAAGPSPLGISLIEGVAGGRFAGDGDAAAVHHAFDVNLGRHRDRPPQVFCLWSSTQVLA